MQRQAREAYDPSRHKWLTVCSGSRVFSLFYLQRLRVNARGYGTTVQFANSSKKKTVEHRKNFRLYVPTTSAAPRLDASEMVFTKPCAQLL